MPQGLGISEAPAFMLNAQYRPIANNAQAAMGDMGVKGGGGSIGGVAAAPQWGVADGPDNAMPEFFNTLLGDRVQAAKRANFYEGFARARAGKTLDQIQKDTPWYAKAFGDTEFESGAAVYTASASVAEMTREMQDNMDELRKKTPEEMGQWMNDKSESMLTGDTMADAVMQKSFLEHSGPLLEMQAKANYAWKQEELSTSQYGNMMSQARSYQTSENKAWQFGQEHPDQQPNDPHGAAERERMLYDAFQMPDGQNEASFEKNLENFAYGAGREGLWHAVTAMQNSGLYQRLPVDQQERIEKRLATIKHAWLNNIAGTPEMNEAGKIVAAVHGGVISGNDAIKATADFNRKFTARTGYPDAYFDNSDIQALTATSGEKVYSALQRQQERAAALKAKQDTQADKDHAEAAEAGLISKAITMGTVGDYLIQPGSDEKKADYAMSQFVTNAVKGGNSEGAMTALEANFNNPRNRYVSKNVQSQLKNAITSGAGLSYNDSIDGAYKLWQQMFYRKAADGKDDGAGPAMASTYFGEQANNMFEFDTLTKNGIDREDAYQKVWGKDAMVGPGDLRGGQGEKVNRAALASAVSDLSPGVFQRMTGADALSDSAKELIAYHASQFFGQQLKQAPYLGPEVLAKQAVNHFVNTGGEIAGRYAWTNGPKSQSVSKQLGMPPDVFGQVFDAAVSGKLRKQGLSVDDNTKFEVLRLPDDKKGVRMIVTGYSKDGTMKAAALTSSDFNELRDEWNSRVGNSSGLSDDPVAQMFQ